MAPPAQRVWSLWRALTAQWEGRMWMDSRRAEEYDVCILSRMVEREKVVTFLAL